MSSTDSDSPATTWPSRSSTTIWIGASAGVTENPSPLPLDAKGSIALEDAPNYYVPHYSTVTVFARLRG
jgi:hypothetical protein